jgi:hypothetical protein
MRFRLAASFLVSITTCSSHGGSSRAEVLPTPLPGTVLTARAMGGACSSDGCLFDYKVRITNPTDRDADVQECSLAEPRDMQLSVTGSRRCRDRGSFKSDVDGEVRPPDTKERCEGSGRERGLLSRSRLARGPADLTHASRSSRTSSKRRAKRNKMTAVRIPSATIPIRRGIR